MCSWDNNSSWPACLGSCQQQFFSFQFGYDNGSGQCTWIAIILVCIQLPLSDFKVLWNVNFRIWWSAWNHERPSAQFDLMNRCHLRAACRYHSGCTNYWFFALKKEKQMLIDPYQRMCALSSSFTSHSIWPQWHFPWSAVMFLGMLRSKSGN
jgi:hypothetical protein